MGHRSTALKCGYPYENWMNPGQRVALTRGFVKKVINPSCSFGADTRNLAQIGDRGPLDGLQGTEMAQQGPLARRPDAGNLLKPGFADVPAAALPVRPDGKPMGLVAQALHEIEHRIARRQAERLPPRHMEGFAPRIAAGALG